MGRAQRALRTDVFASGPWWLVRNNRREEAKNSIRRTAPPGFYNQDELDARIALIDHTYELEIRETRKDALLNCFKGTNLRRLEIVSRYTLPSSRRSLCSAVSSGPYNTGVGSP
jgi:hypothetical protein